MMNKRSGNDAGKASSTGYFVIEESVMAAEEPGSSGPSDLIPAEKVMRDRRARENFSYSPS